MGTHMTRYKQLTLAAAIAASLIAIPVAQADLPVSIDGQALPSLAPMLKKAMPAVVNISTRTHIDAAQNPLMQDPFFQRFFNLPNIPQQRRESSSLGSGVIIDARRGYVLTNNHVIDKADKIQVTLHDGRQLAAKLVGTDPDSDVAVIQVEARDLEALPIADSSQVQIGDFVVAIGNPFGLGQTVTSGIISALGRSGLGIEGYEDFIQTDASINPGNSGGALVNLRGELIGINTAILAPNGGNVGIGFAIPSNMVESIKNILIEHGEVKRGLLGVTVQDLTPDLAQAFGLKRHQGAVVTAVKPGSPAEKAGLEAGDVFVTINHRPIKQGSDVRNSLGLAQVGEEVQLEVLRKGESETLTAKIVAPKLAQEDGKRVHPRLAGTVLNDAPPQSPYEGVVVERIHTGSYAFQAGLRPGDIIVMANKKRVSNLEDLQAAAGPGQLLLNLQRGDAGLFLLLR
jgi:Do/DeqQ family serine protease